MLLRFVLRVWLLLLCGCPIGMALAEPRSYVVDVHTAPPVKGSNYFTDLLNLLLNASKAPDETIEFRYSDKPITQARWIMALTQDTDNNVLWVMTNKERENNLRAVRVPLLKGLMGYRVLVIRKSDEEIFKQVKTRQDLLALKAGQGMHWPDTDILRVNQFQTVEALAIKNLYKMLAAKRFDFFPRGITEVHREDGLISSQHLMIEPHLLLHYPADFYFFVNKKNTELATRLEKGWAIIQKNGEFEKFFLGNERVRAALAILNKRDRTVIELDNPFLTNESAKLLMDTVARKE